MTAAPKILIFDFDGTVANTFDLAISTTNLLASQFNYKRLEPDELKIIRNMSIHKIIRHLRIPIAKLPVILAKGRQEMRSHISAVKPVTGLPAVLKQLRSMNIKMGILTSNSEEAVKSFLNKNNLRFFEFSPARSSIWGKAKQLRSFMKNHALAREDLIYVGDESRDVKAAAQVGIQCVAVAWGYNSAEVLRSCNPDYLITTPKELIPVCSELISQR